MARNSPASTPPVPQQPVVQPQQNVPQPRQRGGRWRWIAGIVLAVIVAAMLARPLFLREGDEKSEGNKTMEELGELKKGERPTFVEKRMAAFYNVYGDSLNTVDRAWGWGKGTLLGYGEVANWDFAWFAWSAGDTLTFEVSIPIDDEIRQGIQSLGPLWKIRSHPDISQITLIERSSWMRDFSLGKGEKPTYAYERCLFETTRELRKLRVFVDFRVGDRFD